MALCDLRRLAACGALLLTILVGRASPCFGAAALSGLSGSVRVRSGEDGAWSQAASGQRLSEGAQVSVGAFSRAVVGFDDGSRVELGAQSLFTLDEAGRKGGAVQLAFGFLMAWIHRPSPGFRVRTASAVVAVRGTQFSVAAEHSGKTRVRVFSGTVSVKDNDGREVVLKQDQGVEASGRGVGRPQAAEAAHSVGDCGWSMSPPQGFSATTLPSGKFEWKRVSDEDVRWRGESMLMRHTEEVWSWSQSAAWRAGQAWPLGCEQPYQERSRVEESVEGRPAFSYTCVNASGTPSQTRHYDVAVDYDGGSSGKALRLEYQYTTAFPGPGPLGNRSPNLESLWKARQDQAGPGLAAFLEAIHSLRAPAAEPRRQAAPAESHDVAPLLR